MASTRVETGTALVEVLKRVLHQARRAGVRPSLLLLDRGVYSVAVIRYLQAARYPFIMPVISRGRKPSHPKGVGGTRILALYTRSAWSSSTLTATTQPQASVKIGVHCRNWRGRAQRHGRQRRVYACWGFRPTTTHWVFQVYRERFGIETRYRQLGEACIKTTTRNPTLRLLFVGIALLLRNLWVHVH